MTHLIYQDKYKRVYKTAEGEIKEIPLDENHRAAVNAGVHIQPIGKDKRQFFNRYQHLKEEYQGHIVDKYKTMNKRKEQDQEAEQVANELYREGLKGMSKKYL